MQLHTTMNTNVLVMNSTSAIKTTKFLHLSITNKYKITKGLHNFSLVLLSLSP